MECPRCKSENTQRLEVVYNGGTTHINIESETVGVGLAGASPAYGGAVTTSSGKSQTELARNATPPARPKIGGLFSSILLIIVILGGAAVAWVLFSGLLVFIANKLDMVGKSSNVLIFGIFPVVLLLITLFMCYGIIKGNSKANNQRILEEYEQKYWKWKNSWMCQRCGEIYTRD